jgi:hypothetical protein
VNGEKLVVRSESDQGISYYLPLLLLLLLLLFI